MPNNIRVIHARDFISATPRGEFDLASSKKLLQAVAATAAQQQHDVILDIRDARSNMTAADLWAPEPARIHGLRAGHEMAVRLRRLRRVKQMLTSYPRRKYAAIIGDIGARPG